MSIDVHIDPVIAELATGRGPLRIAEIGLGGVPRGAVVILTDDDGLDSASVFMNRLAEHGYESIAADLTRRHAGSGQDDGVGDVAALLDRFVSRGWSGEQVGAIGFGRGAETVARVARDLELGAAVSVAPSPSDLIGSDLIGSCRPVERAHNFLRTPWLCLVAKDDDNENAIAAFEKQTYDVSPVHTQVIAYRSVPENFYRDDGDSFAHAAAFDAWQRTVEWLNLRVVPRPSALGLAWDAKQESETAGATLRRTSP